MNTLVISFWILAGLTVAIVIADLVWFFTFIAKVSHG